MNLADFLLIISRILVFRGFFPLSQGTESSSVDSSVELLSEEEWPPKNPILRRADVVFDISWSFHRQIVVS